jgi:hypothetical protein
MARGGYRPGAERPKGSSNKRAPIATEAARREAAAMGPMDIALSVIRERFAANRNDIEVAKLAVQIAGYFIQKFRATDQPAAPHPEQKLLDLPLFSDHKPTSAGKKEQAQAAALTAGAGTDWGDDLATDAKPN